jgi:hypothetical protein
MRLGGSSFDLKGMSPPGGSIVAFQYLGKNGTSPSVYPTPHPDSKMSSQASREEYELPLIDSQSPSGDASRLKQGGLKHGRLHKWLSGSRFALVLASAACIIVLSFNLGFLLWVVDRNRLKDDRGTLYEGDCDRVRHLSTGLHLLINILSTTLLGASNYGMVRGTLVYDWARPDSAAAMPLCADEEGY